MSAFGDAAAGVASTGVDELVSGENKTAGDYALGALSSAGGGAEANGLVDTSPIGTLGLLRANGPQKFSDIDRDFRGGPLRRSLSASAVSGGLPALGADQALAAEGSRVGAHAGK